MEVIFQIRNYSSVLNPLVELKVKNKVQLAIEMGFCVLII